MFRTLNNARFWDRAARKYAAGSISDMAGYDRTLERTRDYLKDTDVAFEFGCGTGTTALRLAPSVAQIAATDISSEMIAIVREKVAVEGVSNVSFDVATPDDLPWPDETYNAALGFNVLHLLDEREAALKSVHRILKPGGLFISKTPCLNEMSSIVRFGVPVMQLFGKAPYVAFFSAEELEREVAAAGFEIIERGRHGSGRKDPRLFLVARKR
ncbi:class I SAM-dependent methyltransferase [Filomicrobium sp.]|uniref:class I SAM-dependent methyltransferase n=1 Tax=Filomicrobium sp. TaxID=2024831 RepID=UPI0025906A25|nr:class I SAM-dependent methyltransferase [Filomicrobium sp.]MCV0368840.1 class I SAM-dependent methyltransferase [Filomicrobium sp.]